MKNHLLITTVESTSIKHSKLNLNWRFRSFLIAIFLLLTGVLSSQAQLVNVPVTGFNNDIVANGGGVAATPNVGVSFPANGFDGAGYCLVQQGYTIGVTTPTCFMPTTNTVASLLTPGLTYNLQGYGTNVLNNNNALTLTSPSGTYTSPFPSTGSLTLSTPASYAKLYFLVGSVINNVSNTMSVTVTFSDATTQVFTGASFPNWFSGSAALTAAYQFNRLNPNNGGFLNVCTSGTYTSQPSLFEYSVSISNANLGKLVSSVSFTSTSTSSTGTTPSSVNYLHIMAMGGIAPCATPIDQPSALNLTSPTGTTINGTFTAAGSAPSGYLTVVYPAGATPTEPSAGTTYTIGNSLGLGKVAGAGASTSFAATGLYPGITYDVYVYSYNSGACATVYNTTSPLSGSLTTSGIGATLLISPYGDGGFETGNTLALNNWQVVNSATNAWTVGTVPTGFTNRSAFISNDAGTSWVYTNTSLTASHIYKDITFPAGQNEITLSFNWKALGEASSWDAIIVYSCPTSITPLAGSPTGTGNAATWTGGSPTALGSQLWNQGTNLQTFSICLPASFAGTTQRIVITWKNDGTAGTSPPAAVDNIALVSSTPTAPADQATALNLTTISTSQINGSFTAATSAPTGYLVVRYPSAAATTAPATGTVYTVGQTLGLGTVVSVGASTTFNSTGLSGSTTYDYYVYDYGTATCSGTVYNTVAPLTGSQTTSACGTLSGTIPVGPTAPASPAGFPSLTAAMAYINSNGLGAATILELQTDYVTGVETYPIIFPFNACVSASRPLTIRPAAAVASPFVFTSASFTNLTFASATFVLDGASYVTIDGRNGGTGSNKFIRIINTSSTAASAGNAILLRNDANNNTLTYLDLQASNLNPASNSGTITAGAVPGVISILSTTGTGGNDNNTISNCDIHSATAVGNILNVGIYAYNATTVGNSANNDNNTITNCNIYDCFNANTATAGIDILTGNNSYTITNNSYYKSAALTYTYATAAITHRGFWVTPGSSAVGSSAYTITGNFIGGTAASCGGAAYTMLGAVTTVFHGMDISVGTLSTSNVNTNTIQNIAFTTTSTSNPYFSGISIASGNVNVGNTVGTGNTIGSGTGNGSITLNNSTTSSSTSVAYGIRAGGGAILNANYNTVGSITINNGLISNSFVAIGVVGGGTTSITINNNTIGSTSTANSIQTTGTGAALTAMGMCGIFISTGPGTSTINNNTIANLNTSYTGTTTTTALTVRGIDVAVGANTIDNNTIRNITSASLVAGSGNTSAICGLVMRSGTAPSTVTNNKIFSLKLTTSSTTTGTQITGIVWNPAASGTNLLARNFIHSFDVSYTTTTSTTATFTGVDAGTGISTIQNNMIRLGINDAGASVTTPLVMRGFSIGTTSATNLFHNSVYLGGTGVTATVSANHSAAFNRSATSGTLVLRNNIFANARTNAASGQTNKHYVMRLGTATTGADFDYNDYYATAGNDNSFGLINVTPVAAYSSGWITGDLNSLTGDPMFLTPAGNSSTVDLHINPVPQTVIEQGGTVAFTITDDYDGQTRSTLSPVDMGADAGNFTPLNPCSGPPASATAAFTNATPICGTGAKTIILTGYTAQPGYTFQWQESVSGTLGSFVNVSTGTGATTNSFTTATLASSMYYQCVIGCSFGGGTINSSSVQAIINPVPVVTATPLTGTNVCSGSNVDLTASGASTYAWTCNPGVAGYPNVSLFSTPNNLTTVTSRPTSTLASSTAAPPATVATPTWTYTVTGTSAAGCVASPVNVVLNVITTAVVPLQLTYTSSPSASCAPGTPVTFTLNNTGTIGAGTWTYNWYDQTGTTLLQTVTNTSATDNYTTVAPVANGNYVYTAKVSNSLCPSSYAIASPTFFVGYTSLNVVNNANCGNNGVINVYPEGQNNFSSWYSNDFNTALLGPAFDGSLGNLSLTSGRCNITSQVNGQNGMLIIRNSGAINTNNLQVDFKLSTAPRGFAFNILGADGLAWSYGGDLYTATTLTPGTGGFNAESGSGSGFKLAFDATANGGINTPGAYLMYNCTTPDQGPNSAGVLAFKQGSFWQGLVDAPVSIVISQNGFVSVTINNQLIFDHVPLPAAYLTTNKSNWIHTFTARTGGSNQLHAIDDLNIRYNTYEYSNNSTTGLDGTWQLSNKFSGLAAGSYPIWVRNPASPSCVANTGTAIVSTSPSPSSALTVAASGFNTTICAGSSTDLTTDIEIPGATFLWESASAIGGPYTAATGTNNLATYSTGALNSSTYYRVTFTCPSSSPITSTPALVTVNAGSLSATNSPQMINCVGDAANLTATPGPNTTLVWYDVPTGGSPIGSGNSVSVTPTVLPATYYIEATTTTYTNQFSNGGQKVLSNGFGTTGSGTGVATRFTTTASIRVDQIKVFPTSTGTLTVVLQNSGSATVLQTYSMTITTPMVGNITTVPVNFAIAGSGSFQITTSGVACTYYSSGFPVGAYSASYMFMGGVMQIVGSSSTETGATSTTIYGTAFDWTITTACPTGLAARTPVIVNANPTFFVTVAPPTSTNICPGVIQSLTASSANAYSSYTWSPVTNLYSDAGATVPLTITDNQAVVYFKATGASSNTYTVSTAGSGCLNTATASVSSIDAPVVTASATPAVIASGANSQLTAGVVAGNANNYTFSASNGTFTPISGGTATSVTTTADEEMSTAFPIGFNFGFAGTTYTTVQAGSNGVLLFGSGKTNTLTNNLATTTASQRPGVAPLWDDIQCSNGIRYAVTGTPGSQVLTVEWINMEWTYTSSSNVISFQAKLYEGTNVIQFVYRDEAAAVVSGSASIGIMGSAASDFISVQSSSAAPTTSTSSSTNTISTEPATGQIYTFTPPNTTAGYTFDWSANPTFLSATNIYNPVATAMTSNQTYSVTVTSPAGCPATQTTAVSVLTAAPNCATAITINNVSCVAATSISWTASSSPFTLGYYVFVGTDGAGVTTPSDLVFGQDVGLATTIALPLLASGINYYYQIQPYNAFGTNTACSIGSFTSGPNTTQTPTQSINSYTETIDNGVTPPALPCGMSSSNENFPADAFTWYSSTTAPRSGLRHLQIDKNTNNTTAKDDWFYSAPMNLTAGKLYRIYFWHRVGTAGSETFEVYLSNSADAATMTTTAAIFNGSSNLITYKLDSSANILPAVSGVYYYGFHANGTANGRSLYMDDIQVREIPVAALDPGSCITLASMYDQILVQPIYQAQDYKFLIENLATSFSYEYTRNVAIPDFRLKWAPGVTYGLTYDVSVSYKKNNVWSPYGAPCPVTMGPFPTTKLRGTSCGASLTDQYTPLYYDSIAGANDYEIKIVQNTLAYDHTWTRGGSQLDYRLYWAYQSAPSLVERVPFGFTYDVQVRALVGRTGPAQGNLVGTWGTFGPTCTVTLLGQPQTQLVAAPGPQQSCGKILVNLNDPIYCIPVSGASNYRYRVVNTALGYDVTTMRNSSVNDFRLTWLPTVGGIGLRFGTTYDITVSDYVGGVWSLEGPICQVTTPASPLTSLQPAYCPYTLPTFSTPVYSTTVIGATNYRYRITDVASSGAVYTKIVDRNSPGNDFRFSWTLVCCGGLNMLPNTAYNVEVASYAGGVWSAYGSVCVVTTGASVPRYSQELAEEGLFDASSATALSLNVYPNPAAVSQEFAVELNGIEKANETVLLDIYNVLGERVYRSQIITKEESRMVIKPEQVLAPGVYTIEARLNGSTNRVKFVMQ